MSINFLIRSGCWLEGGCSVLLLVSHVQESAWAGGLGWEHLGSVRRARERKGMHAPLSLHVACCERR